MTDRLRLELPFPPKELSPNSRVSWRERARVVAQYRQDCGWTATVAIRIPGVNANYLPLTPPVEAVVRFVMPDRRKRDLDNLCAMLKPAWDGLIDAGVLAGDDSERFRVASAEIAYTNGQPPGFQRSCVIVILFGLGESK